MKLRATFEVEIPVVTGDVAAVVSSADENEILVYDRENIERIAWGFLDRAWLVDWRVDA